MNRIVVPEILDELSPDDPAAIRSRCDLRMINQFMRGQEWILNQLTGMNDVKRVVELGAGDGELCNRIKKQQRDCEVVGLDLITRPDSVDQDVLWESVSVLDYDGYSSDTVVVANLFIHHLQKDELNLLGEKMKSVRAVLFSEPYRGAVGLWMGRLIFPLVNYVTRHDMIVSIKAGFKNGEIESLLGGDFQWEESKGLCGGFRVKGVRL